VTQSESKSGPRVTPLIRPVSRPLDAGPYTYVWLDALFHKVREGGRVVSVATVITTGVNADGHREVLGVDVLDLRDQVVLWGRIASRENGRCPGCTVLPTPPRMVRFRDFRGW
jgi:hypothetical protein